LGEVPWHKAAIVGGGAVGKKAMLICQTSISKRIDGSGGAE